MDAQVVNGQAVARGLWQLEANHPLLVSDPPKARYLLGLDRHPPTERARARHEAGIMPYSAFLRAIPRLDSPRLRELEALLSGGEVFARDEWHNIVVNEGLTYALGAALDSLGTTPDSSWFVGLTSTAPTVAAANTLASHAGWTEVTAYDEVGRRAWTEAGAAAQSISNSASPAVFTINANGTVIGGAFLAGVTTGTAGILYAAGAFTAGDKSLDDNDTLSVTITATLAAA